MTNNARRAPGRRSDAQAARTKARITRRAETLFARYGYQGAAMRELAEACGVHMFTIQHHFGSKLGLYREVLKRGDEEVLALLERIVAEETEVRPLVRRIVDELFDFFRHNGDWVALNARAMLGEKLPGRGPAAYRGWVAFMDRTIRERGLGEGRHDLRLILLTVEGMLNNHALAFRRRRHLVDGSGEDAVAATKRHLERTILAILDTGEAT